MMFTYPYEIFVTIGVFIMGTLIFLGLPAVICEKLFENKEENRMTFLKKFFLIVSFPLFLYLQVMFTYHSALDFLGPSTKCAVFEKFDKQTSIRTPESAIVLQNYDEALIFKIGQNSFNNLNIKKDDNICWEDWKIAGRRNLRKS